ncbi:MAG: L,D-transpeptidase family protein [Sulfurimonas sp.]
MRIITLLLFLLFLMNPAEARRLTIENITANIQNSLQTHLKGKNRPIILNLYEKSGYRPLWMTEKNRIKRNELIQVLKDPLFNYKDKPFDQPSIAKLFYMLDNDVIADVKKEEVLARLDLMLTNSFVRLIRFIIQSDVDWELVQKKLAALKESDDIKAEWEISVKPFPGEESLNVAIESGNIRSYLLSLLPMEKRYKKLVRLLKNYRVMDKFPKIPYMKNPLKMGEDKESISNIKKRLQISGDYPKNAPIDTKFDKTLYDAAISYQKRYNLKVDGKIDRVMTYYLNQPVKTNIQSIITNLDKTKLYPKIFEEEHIEVNVPDFNLRYYKNDLMHLKMGAVVGRIDRPTPLFADKIEYMVVNPTWTITDNLVKRDLIPVLKENPDYLLENNITVYQGKKEVEVTYEILAEYEKSVKRVPYRFIQQPGDNNALGRVKFIFPNKYAVYLHDTDNKSLLSRRYKIYSSGCIRVQKPFELMNRLLEYTHGKYDREKIEKIFESNEPTIIRLSKHIPVYITYFTVYEEEGKAYFKNDIYLYDKIIEESIRGKSKPTFTVPEKRMVSVKKNAQAPKPKKKD